IGGAVPRNPMIAPMTSSNAAAPVPNQTMLRAKTAARKILVCGSDSMSARACLQSAPERRKTALSTGDRRGPMQQIRRLCVYCGSAGAVDERYRAAALELGEGLAQAGIELVYGGGRVGL